MHIDINTICKLLNWLDKNEIEIELTDENSPLTLHMPFLVDERQTIQIAAHGWVTRKTKWVDATIFSSVVRVELGEIEDKRTKK